jgi:outer membrane protein OmpA-like peptidoglycan-associated protein
VYKYLLCLLIVFLFAVTPSNAQESPIIDDIDEELPASSTAPSEVQESPWYEGFFIEASALVHFTPKLLKGYIKPGFGFRGALGYEYKHFRFAIESGYSHFAGTDSLITKVGFIPLVFKFGYALPIFSIFGLQADINAGLAFSNTTHYPNEFDLDMNKIQKDRANSLILGGRLYATVTPLDFLRIYAGGGVDLILEKEGPLLLPLVEIGVHFKPFVLARKKQKKQEELPKEIEPVIEEPATEVTEEEVVERVAITLPYIQFQADSDELHDSEKLKLQEIAGILRDIPGVKIQVEGHTARAGTEGRRVVFSRERAQAVASYLVSLGVVDEADVTVIGHGAEKPIADNATEEGRSANRRVEIIILEDDEVIILEDGEIIILENVEIIISEN